MNYYNKENEEGHSDRNKALKNKNRIHRARDKRMTLL